MVKNYINKFIQIDILSENITTYYNYKLLLLLYLLYLFLRITFKQTLNLFNSQK